MFTAFTFLTAIVTYGALAIATLFQAIFTVHETTTNAPISRVTNERRKTDGTLGGHSELFLNRSNIYLFSY